MTHVSNTSNHHPLYPRDDRETLSALFDGELPGDAARFALKRLDHDADWRETCGRWQLIGDALRGEATSAAPANFAAGVMRKLAAEAREATVAATPAVPKSVASAVASRRRWLGGAALAASVAVAAVLVSRPFSQPSSTPAQMQVATGEVAAPVAPQRMAQSGGTTVPATASTALSPSTTRVAATDTPSSARPRPSRPVRIAPRPVRPPVNDTATAVAAAEPATTQKPFHPSTDEVATRPWPRAVLSESGGENFTVGFGATSTPTSSLYPFEPRLPEAAAPKPAVNEPQR